MSSARYHVWLNRCVCVTHSKERENGEDLCCCSTVIFVVCTVGTLLVMKDLVTWPESTTNMRKYNSSLFCDMAYELYPTWIIHEPVLG